MARPSRVFEAVLPSFSESSVRITGFCPAASPTCTLPCALNFSSRILLFLAAGQCTAARLFWKGRGLLWCIFRSEPPANLIGVHLIAV